MGNSLLEKAKINHSEKSLQITVYCYCFSTKKCNMKNNSLKSNQFYIVSKHQRGYFKQCSPYQTVAFCSFRVVRGRFFLISHLIPDFSNSSHYFINLRAVLELNLRKAPNFKSLHRKDLKLNKSICIALNYMELYLC